MEEMSEALVPPRIPEMQDAEEGAGRVPCVPVGVTVASKSDAASAGAVMPGRDAARAGTAQGSKVPQAGARSRGGCAPQIDARTRRASCSDPARGARSSNKKPRLWARTRLAAGDLRNGNDVAHLDAAGVTGRSKRQPWCSSTKVSGADAATLAREREREREREEGRQWERHRSRERLSHSPIQRKRKGLGVGGAGAEAQDVAKSEEGARKENRSSQARESGKQGYDAKAKDDTNKKQYLSKSLPIPTVNKDIDKRKDPAKPMASPASSGRGADRPALATEMPRKQAEASEGARKTGPGKSRGLALVASKAAHQQTPHRPQMGTPPGPTRSGSRSGRLRSPTGRGQTPPTSHVKSAGTAAKDGTPASAKSIFSDSEDDDEDFGMRAPTVQTPGAAHVETRHVAANRAAAATPPQIQDPHTADIRGRSNARTVPAPATTPALSQRPPDPSPGTVAAGSEALHGAIHGGTRNFASFLDDDEDEEAEGAAAGRNGILPVERQASTDAGLAGEEIADGALSTRSGPDWVAFSEETGDHDNAEEVELTTTSQQHQRVSEPSDATSTGGQREGGGRGSAEQEDLAQDEGTQATVRHSYDAVVQQLAGMHCICGWLRCASWRMHESSQHAQPWPSSPLRPPCALSDPILFSSISYHPAGMHPTLPPSALPALMLASTAAKPQTLNPHARLYRS